MYVINIVVKDILQYIKHLNHDVQWRKAKAHAFENINEETVFWLRGYCQKIFQWDFVKGRRSILGRKWCLFMLMSFFMKKNHILQTSIFYCFISLWPRHCWYTINSWYCFDRIFEWWTRCKNCMWKICHHTMPISLLKLFTFYAKLRMLN